MEGAITISKQLPPRPSMQYENLRQLGIRHIQELAGKLWTDYNTHDPGITMLEVLCYALTELGYRVNYDIVDLLAQDPNDPAVKSLQNFYTACEILPNCPLTLNDYRKLMMDVEVIEEEIVPMPRKIYSGVKNAWINCVQNAGEKEVFVDRKHSRLSLAPVPHAVQQESYFVKTLYDVLLEFDKNDKYGDLNENRLSSVFEPQETIFDSTDTDGDGKADYQPVLGTQFLVRIEFPRWDESDLNWDSLEAVKGRLTTNQIEVEVIQNPSGYEWTFSWDSLTGLHIEGKKGSSNTANDVETHLEESLALHLNLFIDDLITTYQAKVKKIEEIICAVRERLHANRNLCDDFFRFRALKIEEIILCSDIELRADADVEAVEAAILLAVADFLAPKVYFYTLEEMRNKCRSARRYSIAAVDDRRSIFTISEAPSEDLNPDDSITVEGIPAAGVYTVKCISPNEETAGHVDIQIREEILSEERNDEAALFIGIEEANCPTVDEIFEGPKLKHGFIDDAELARADRKKYVRVSDLIRIIMDVEGVVTVKNIQIANRALDNDSNIESKSVRWCLELALEQGYVPRLNVEDSILTFYKGQIPFISKKSEVYERIDQLEKGQRSQKIRYPLMDIPVPQGEYKALEEYTSIQEHFPQFYGLGEEGIPGLSALDPDQRKARESSTNQHKAFLLFFEQLLANFTSQLGHLGELFSMNGDKNQFGEYEIQKSYFGQPLYDTVPNATHLYVNQDIHDLKLAEMIESTEVFEPRRNKFLDHLLGRFAESFTDYALLTYKVSGAKAPLELIEDKLQFLKKYPVLSAARGKGINYKAPCNSWHVENVSGLEMRASLLLGITEKPVEELVFSANFSVLESSGVYGFEIRHADSSLLLKNAQDYTSEAEVRAAIESVILNGVCPDNYKMEADGPGSYLLRLYCKEVVLAESSSLYTSLADLYADLDKMVETLLEEFNGNPESNRRNLACPLYRYIRISNYQFLTTPAPASLSFDYEIYDHPLDDPDKNLLFSGTVTRQSETDLSGDALAGFTEKYLWEILTMMLKPSQYLFNSSDGNYRFYLCDRFGNEVTVGKSHAADFNDLLQEELQNLSNLSGQTVRLSAPQHTATVHTTTFHTEQVEEDLVSLELDNPLPADLDDLPASDMQLQFRNVFAIAASNAAERWFEISVDFADLSKYLSAGDEISIYNAGLITLQDSYTILDMSEAVAGTTTKVWVQEPLPDIDHTPFFAVYQKQFSLYKITSGRFYFKGGLDQEALNTFIDFIRGKFFSQEGMHLIEHHLLRPRYCSTLLEEDGDPGQLSLRFCYPIVAVESNPGAPPGTPKFRLLIQGAIPDALQNAQLQIEGKPFNSRPFELSQVLYSSMDDISMLDIIADNMDASDLEPDELVERNAIFEYQLNINAIDTEDHCITISVDPDVPDNVADRDILELITTILDPPADPSFALPKQLPEVRIEGSAQTANNRLFLIEEISQPDNDTFRICFASDPLLPIHLDQDCENCKITDPYSCIATVILPYWPGRFPNREVRKFIEKTLRTEAPAHLFLNICWVNCEHLAAFEYAYRNWLLAWSKKVPDPVKVHQSLKELIAALTEARTVYPKGTLHSCDDDDTFEGSIILNNAALGMF